jgi:RND family efflux transporter MFP subunit
MNFFVKIKEVIFRHKIITSIIIIILLGCGYWWYSSSTNTSGVARYVLSAAAKGTIVSSVSGTGQVSASNQMTLSPGSGASGEIVYLNAVSGQKVSAGTLLLELDAANAQKTVRDAQANLDSAKITLQRLEGAGNLSTPQNKQDAINTLNQDYQSGYNTVSAAFVDLPTIMTDLQNVVYGNNFNNYQQNIDYYANTANNYDPNAIQFRDSLVKSYQIALTEYNKNFTDYKNTTRTSDNATIDSIISETYNTTRDMAQAAKDTNNLIQFYINTLTTYNLKINSIANTQLSTINSDSSKANSDISSLLNIQSTISKDKESVANSDLDLQSQQLSLQNSQNSLQDAKDNLANYYIYAPFDGVVGAVSVEKGQTISSGTSAITFITQTELTTISLSEQDVTKIKLGDKAVITFDAIDGLSVAGKVTEIDTIGTVSQGVVSYNVQITFDTQDSRVKPGMSTSVNVITDIQQNVLTIPNSAVKTKNGSSYVLVLNQKEDLANAAAAKGFASAIAPIQRIVQIGVADSVNTEITNGLSEGDQVVIRTISGAKTTTGTASSTTSNATRQATRSLTGGGAGGPPGGF